jgi:SAM-dependent methyltransferase
MKWRRDYRFRTMIEADPMSATLPGHASFDAVAAAYDAQFTHHPLGQWMRKAVHRHLAACVQPGDSVLELGCGTGEDAIWLARLGARVTATDASAAMLEAAAAKAAAAGDADRLTFAQLDLEQPGRWEPADQYDFVLANFGVLNCLPDRRPLAAALARWMRPGGRVALVLMSPFCPWEIMWFGMHGRFYTAFRRFRSGEQAHVGNGATVRVWYPSPRRLRADFAPHFRPLYHAGIGVLLPPSYLSHLVTRWPRFFTRLAGWEHQLERHFPWSWCADHFLQLLERTPVNNATSIE